MTSFGWKRKLGGNVSKSLSQNFEENSKDSHENLEEVDWLTLAPKKKIICLEDTRAKSERLKQEGSLLADSERYWEAISKWEEAIALTPEDETLHEMRAQSYLLLNEVYPAVQAAVKCTEVNPLWWVGHQTLGRTQLGLGDVVMAVKSFSRAIHLYPADEELWKEDLMWARSLLDQHQKLVLEQATENQGCTVTEVQDPPSQLAITSPHSSKEKGDSQISTSPSNPSEGDNCDLSVHTEERVSTHSGATSNWDDSTGNQSITCIKTNRDSSCESGQGKETKCIPVNYVRMRMGDSHQT